MACQNNVDPTSELCVSGLCEGNPPVTDGSPSQRASNAENVSTRWGYHAFTVSLHCHNGRHVACIKAVQGECQRPLKNDGNSHRSREPRTQCDWGNTKLYLDLYQSQKWVVSQSDAMPHTPTDSATAIRLGLSSSLYMLYPCLSSHIDGLVQERRNSTTLAFICLSIFSVSRVLFFRNLCINR